MEKEMAHDALEDGIEMEAISPTHSQPLEGYDVLEDEIQVCERTSRITSADENATETTTTPYPAEDYPWDLLFKYIINLTNLSVYN